MTAAAKETLPVKQHRPMRKRYVSDRTRQLYGQRRNDFEKLTDDERRAATRAIGVSCREDFRDYVDGVLKDIEIAERGGNSREVSKLNTPYIWQARIPTRQPIQRPQRKPAGHTGPATRGVVNVLGSEVR